MDISLSDVSPLLLRYYILYLLNGNVNLMKLVSKNTMKYQSAKCPSMKRLLNTNRRYVYRGNVGYLPRKIGLTSHLEYGALTMSKQKRRQLLISSLKLGRQVCGCNQGVSWNF